MEILVELLLSCFVEVGEEISVSKNVPRGVALVFGILLALLYFFAFGILFVASIAAWKANVWVGLFMFLLTFCFLYHFVKKCRETYHQRKR